MTIEEHYSKIKHWYYWGRLASFLLSEEWFYSLPQINLFLRRCLSLGCPKMVTLCYNNTVSFLVYCPCLSFKTHVSMGEAWIQRCGLLVAIREFLLGHCPLFRQRWMIPKHITLTKDYYSRTTPLPTDGVRTSHILLRKFFLIPGVSSARSRPGCMPPGS